MHAFIMHIHEANATIMKQDRSIAGQTLNSKERSSHANSIDREQISKSTDIIYLDIYFCRGFAVWRYYYIIMCSNFEYKWLWTI